MDRNVFMRQAAKDVMDFIPEDLRDGLAMVCDISLTKGQDIWRTTVAREMAEKNDYDVDALFDHAMKSFVKLEPPVLADMAGAIFGGEKVNYLAFGERLYPDEKQLMYVLSNDTGVLGASVLFYPGVQEQIANVFDEGYTVLPSSVHEVLIVPDSAGVDAASLKDMVREANRLVVEDKDILSDNIYHYDPKEKTLTTVNDRDDRAPEAGRS